MAALADRIDLAALLQTTLNIEAANVALDIASAVVRNKTRQDFTVAGTVFTVAAPVDEWLSLPQSPVTAVTQVRVNGTVITDYAVYNGRLWRASGWAWPGAVAGAYPVVEVTYSHGYLIVPEDVRTLTLALAAKFYSNPEDVASVAIDDYRGDGNAGMVDQLLAMVVARYAPKSLTVRLR